LGQGETGRRVRGNNYEKGTWGETKKRKRGKRKVGPHFSTAGKKNHRRKPSQGVGLGSRMVKGNFKTIFDEPKEGKYQKKRGRDRTGKKGGGATQRSDKKKDKKQKREIGGGGNQKRRSVTENYCPLGQKKKDWERRVGG